MKLPMISVCTPVYNGENFLEECLNGVLNQTYKNFEYIIVDNASTDNTAQIIKKYADMDERIKVYRNEKTLNIIDSINTCTKYTSEYSQWIKYAFADDYLFPNCLEEMIKVGQKDKDVGIISSYRLYGNKASNVGLPIDQNIFYGPDILKQTLMRKLYVCTSSSNTVMYRKQTFIDLNGLNNNYFHADTELALRILDKYKLGFVHYFLTKTNLHNERGEAYSSHNGIAIKEHLDFGYKNISKYKKIKFNEEEVLYLREFYANQILFFIFRNMCYFKFKNINDIIKSAPSEIRKQFYKSIFQNWKTYIKILLRSIYDYPRYLKNKPTFKHISVPERKVPFSRNLKVEINPPESGSS